MLALHTGGQKDLHAKPHTQRIQGSPLQQTQSKSWVALETEFWARLEKNFYLFQEWFSEYTLRKINMEPENTLLEKENHLPNHHFQVYVNLRGCKQGLLWIVLFPFSTCMVNKHHLWSIPMLPYTILGCPRNLGSKDNFKWVIPPIYLVGGFNPFEKL